MIIDKNLQVSNYVYNKTIKYINDNNIKKIYKKKIRDILVTNNSKVDNPYYIKFTNYIHKIKNKINKLNKKKLKDVVLFIILKKKLEFCENSFKKLKKLIPCVKNNSLYDWELSVHKDIRAGSVFEACKNISTLKMQVKLGNIRFFKMKYRTKKSGKYSMVLTQSMFKLKDNALYFTDKNLKDKKMYFSKRSNNLLSSIKNIKDSRIIKKYGKYFLSLSVQTKITKLENKLRIVGIDPGVRTFLTCYRKDLLSEYHFNEKITDNLDKLKVKLKKRKLKRLKKKTLTKIDKRKENVINELHWKCINHLLTNNDYILLEKFESQGFVKGGKNKTLNRRTNNLKHYKFRERLIYKAKCYNKSVILVNAYLTTKTCSSCGNVKDIGDSKIYKCDKCKISLARDFNSAKNILMKGLLN